MTWPDLTALLPLMIVGVGSVVVMLAIAIRRDHATAATLAMLTLALGFLAVPYVASATPRPVTPLLVIDRFALFYTALFFAAALVVAMLAYDYFQGQSGYREEFYILLLLATLGAGVLASSNHFASFFLGLELLSVSLYALVAYRRDNRLSTEAGIKYLVLAATSSAFVLFGMALVFADRGSLDFAAIKALRDGSAPPGLLFLLGMAMILAGVGFKLALAPFHLWAADVYQGAPAPVAALVASVSKGSMFALLLRLLPPTPFDHRDPLLVALAVMGTASMFVGNLLALRQDNVKRLLAYSSIAQMGYVFVAFLAAGTLAVTAVTFYLVAYIITSLAAFGVVSVLSGRERDADRLADYRGLAWREPLLAGLLTAALLSLAGLPLTVGFIGKFYLLAAGARSGLWGLATILVVNSAIGLYYYLRVVAAMYSPAVEEERVAALAPVSRLRVTAYSVPAGAALAVLGILLIWLGVYPTPLVRLLETVLGATT